MRTENCPLLWAKHLSLRREIFSLARCFLFKVTSGPEPIDNIEWFKDNDLIRSRPRFTQSSQGTAHILDIQAVTCDDEGIYKCVLLNNWGIASCSAEVLVEGE